MHGFQFQEDHASALLQEAAVSMINSTCTGFKKAVPATRGWLAAIWFINKKFAALDQSQTLHFVGAGCPLAGNDQLCLLLCKTLAIAKQLFHTT
jgi:hypothetical protein